MDYYNQYPQTGYRGQYTQRYWGSSQDLMSLRLVAARELDAVLRYLLASREALNEPLEDNATLQTYFAHEANDEFQHYLAALRRLSALDPAQRTEFVEHGLEPYLVGSEAPPLTFWDVPAERGHGARWLRTLEHTVQAIRFELETINAYQKFLGETWDSGTRKIYMEAMNHEKGDLADFNQILFTLLLQDTPQTPEEKAAQPALEE